MISTQLLMLVGGLVTGSALTPTWESDYPTALAQAAQSHKPMAVLINAGEAGKAMPAQAAAALANNFVCVYADVSTSKGREVANSFQLAEGLVISDRDGHVQALRYAGKVSGETVGRLAEQYATPVVVTKTDYAGEAQVAPTVVQASASVPVMAAPMVMSAPVMSAPMMSAPVYRAAPMMSAPVMSAPIYRAAPVYQSVPAYQMVPGMVRSGGCASGNCGR